MIEDLRFKDILNELFEGVYYVDPDRRILFWNKGAERITGYAATEVAGSSCADNILVHMDEHGTNLCCCGCPLTEVMRHGGHHVEKDIYLHHKDGHRVPVSVSVSAMRDKNEKIVGAVEVFRPTVEKVYDEQYVEDLRKAALLDFLTGLPNRRYVEMKLRAAIEERRRHGTPFAVLFIDLDHFKGINDTYGHDVGDMVIKMVAKTLEGNMRAYNIVGRWGGEEFIAIVSHISLEGTSLLTRKLCSLVENSFLDREGNRIRVTATIGAAFAAQDDTIKSVLKRADKALYMGKTEGRNCSVVEEEVMRAP